MASSLIFMLIVFTTIALFGIYVLFFFLEKTTFFQSTVSFFASDSCQSNLSSSIGEIGSTILCTIFKDLRLVIVLVIIVIMALVWLLVNRILFTGDILDYE